MLLAQNELNLFDNPWDIFKRVNETTRFLTIDKIESKERFRREVFNDKELIDLEPKIDFELNILLSSTKYIHERKS